MIYNSLFLPTKVTYQLKKHIYTQKYIVDREHKSLISKDKYSFSTSIATFCLGNSILNKHQSFHNPRPKCMNKMPLNVKIPFYSPVMIQISGYRDSFKFSLIF